MCFIVTYSHVSYCSNVSHPSWCVNHARYSIPLRPLPPLRASISVQQCSRCAPYPHTPSLSISLSLKKLYIYRRGCTTETGKHWYYRFRLVQRYHFLRYLHRGCVYSPLLYVHPLIERHRSRPYKEIPRAQTPRIAPKRCTACAIHSLRIKVL